MRCYDKTHMTSCILCTQESAQCVPDPFLTCVVGSGNETIRLSVCSSYICMIVQAWLNVGGGLVVHSCSLDVVHVYMVVYCRICL